MVRRRRLPAWLLCTALALGLAAAVVGPGHGHDHGHDHGDPHGAAMPHHGSGGVSWPLTLLAGGTIGVYLLARRRGVAAFALLALAVHVHPVALPGQASSAMPPLCCVLAQSADPEPPAVVPVRRLFVRLPGGPRPFVPPAPQPRGLPIRGPPPEPVSPPRAA